MAEILDVHLDLDPLQLADHGDPTRAVYEMSRRVAQDKAAEAKGVLRYDDPRETLVKEGQHPITGQSVLLVSTRWVIDPKP